MKTAVKSRLLALVLLCAISLAFLIGFRFAYGIESCHDLREIIIHLGLWGPVVYIFLSVLLIMMFVPRTLILILGAISFGPVWGTFWVLLASLISSVISFGFARTYGRAWIERTLRKKKWFYRLETITARNGFHFVLLSRISHILHFGATSYVCGVLNVSWGSFFWGTFWGILPGTTIAVGCASVLGCALWDGSRNFSSKEIYHIVIASFLVLVSSLIPLLIRSKKTKNI